MPSPSRKRPAWLPRRFVTRRLFVFEFPRKGMRGTQAFFDKDCLYTTPFAKKPSRHASVCHTTVWHTDFFLAKRRAPRSGVARRCVARRSFCEGFDRWHPLCHVAFRRVISRHGFVQKDLRATHLWATPLCCAYGFFLAKRRAPLIGAASPCVARRPFRERV